MAELRVDRLTVTVADRSPPALESVSCTFAAGSTTLLLGANGSGKSMLLRALLGLVKPTSGTVLFDSQPVGSGARLHRRAGVLFQDVRSQLFGSTVVEDVALSLAYRSDQERSDAESAAYEALERVGIAPLASRHPDELSGGEQRLVALAGAIASRPDVLILDEPLAELDYRALIRVVDLIRHERSRGATVLVTSHETRDLLALSDAVIILNGGRSVFTGPRDQALGHVNATNGLRPISVGES